VTAIATGFGDRFDMEKGRPETKVANLREIREDLDKPTFVRNNEQGQRRTPPVKQPNFMMDDDDQYDIPTFLRKSVD
jgi:cell division protein FtsZ